MRKIVLVFILLYLFTFFLGLFGAIIPPTGLLYNSDELMVAKSTIGLFAGETPTSLAWPATTVLGPLFVIYSCDFLAHKTAVWGNLSSGNINSVFLELSKYMAEFFLNPTRQLVMGRLLILIIASFAPLALFAFIYYNLKKGIVPALIAALLLAVSPSFILQRHCLQADAIALTFWLFSLLFLVDNKALSAKKILLGGFFLGLAIASKFLYLAFIPVAFVILCLPYFVSKRRGLKKQWKLDFLLFSSSLFVTIVLFLPFVWIAPLTVLKSVIGNFLARNSGVGSSWLMLFMEVFPLFIGWFGLLFASVGFVSLFFLLNWQIGLILLTTFIVFLLPVGKASFIYLRYAFPLLPILCVFVGLGISNFLSWLPQFKIKRLIAFMFLGIFIIWGLLLGVKEYRAMHNNDTLNACRFWIKHNIQPDTSIGVPFWLIDNFITPNEVSLRRDLKIIKDPQRVSRRFLFLSSKGKLSLDNYRLNSPLIFSVFGEKERLQAFEKQILLWYFKAVDLPIKRYDVWCYELDEEKIDLMRPEIIGLDRVCEKFHKGSLDLIISGDEIPGLSDYIKKIFYSQNGRNLIIYAKK